LGGKNKDSHLKFEIKFKGRDVDTVLNLSMIRKAQPSSVAAIIDWSPLQTLLN